MEIVINQDEKNYIKKLMKKYEEKEISKLDELRNLDKKAKLGAIKFAYIFGIIGSLILGLGMSISLGIIFEEMMWLGIILGLIGILFICINYNIYKKLLIKGKNKYSSQILKLSKELLNEND